MEVERFPQKPGVYLMKDRKKKILYIGKANNLRARLKQYFLQTQDDRPQIPYLLAKVEEVETIVVTSEKEALLLENDLIKRHKPPYNVQLKDDKSYISLRVNLQHRFPALSLCRVKGSVQHKKELYFGPYTSAHAAKQTLEQLNKLFRLRQCKDQELIRRTRPCILYEMQRCMAPCVGLCTDEEYQEEVQRVVNFLQGDVEGVLSYLKQKMEAYSENLAFEQAQAVHEVYLAMQRTVEKQRVHVLQGKDFDVWGLYRSFDQGMVTLLPFQEGRLLGTHAFPFERSVQEDQEILESLVTQYYLGKQKLPALVLLPLPLSSGVEELITCKWHVPKRGDKVGFVQMAKENAEAVFAREKDQRASLERALSELQEKLELKNFPATIDCIDISHLGGEDPVGAAVRFVDGEAEKASYRSYKIKTTQSFDDYQSMHEVLYRRYQRAKEEGTLPDLVMVDGGKGQLGVAKKVFDSLNLLAIVDLVGLAKEQHRHDKGLTEEQIFILEKKEPILFSRHSQVLFLLQRMRDEAHRFVLRFQKKKRARHMTKSVLDNVEGLGQKRKEKLLRHFGSPKRVLEATREELEQVGGLPNALIEKLLQMDSC